MADVTAAVEKRMLGCGGAADEKIIGAAVSGDGVDKDGDETSTGTSTVRTGRHLNNTHQKWAAVEWDE